MTDHPATRSSLPRGVRPYDWALRQMRVPAAHKVTRGSKDVIVAVIDLGYRFHPDHEGHLWSHPQRADLHGWDFADDDASLDYTGLHAADYYRDHHTFIVGEVAAVAPACPIMVLRVGYGAGEHESWARAVRYAADNGARVLVIPHGYIQGQAEYGEGLFYQGTDFAYPYDNPDLLEADDYAYAKGALIVKGVCDNRGRRVAATEIARPPVFAVGSTNRHGRPSGIAVNADYVAAAAPGGDVFREDPREAVWGTGGAENYVPSIGGCMAAGFAGGTAALVLSRFPYLTPDQLRQVLCNTARGEGWTPLLGHGVLDAGRAVSLREEELAPAPAVLSQPARLDLRDGRAFLTLAVENRGAFDIRRALITLFTGDPARPASVCARSGQPWALGTIQLGHVIVDNLAGFERAEVEIEIFNYAGRASKQVWAEVAALDLGAGPIATRARLRPPDEGWDALAGIQAFSTRKEV